MSARHAPFEPMESTKGRGAKDESKAFTVRVPWGLTLYMLVFRLAMGWIFVFAGYEKVRDGFSAEAFLTEGVTGPLKDWFINLGSSESFLDLVNFLVIYGQLLIGGALIAGLFTRFASAMGLIMMSLFYVAQFPPENNPFLDHLLMYVLVLAMIGFMGAGRTWGLDGMLQKKSKLFQQKAIRLVMS